MNKRILFLSPLAIVLPFVSLSCAKNDFNNDVYHYIEKNNFANDYGDFSYLDDNYVSENIHKINLSTSAKLFRVKSRKQPLIDFRDNIVLVPSELSYQFEWAKKINIITSTETLTFDNDRINKVNYDNNATPEEGIFIPKKDKGNGFNSPFLFIPSSDNKSINSDNFKNSLKNLKSFEIELNEKNDIWVDYHGKLVKENNKINHKSFKLGLLSKLLRNKDFKKHYIQKNKINLETNNYDSKLDNGFDLYSYLIKNKIEIDKLLDFSTNKIIIKTVDDSLINFEKLFENLFIVHNYFDAIPFEIIGSKYKDPFKNLEWFFSYGKDFQKRYYAGSYFISKMNNNITELEINNFYINNNDNLKKITIEYNPLPISQSTFSLQSLNAFKQNIISKLDYETLNLDEKNYILKNYQKYNFSYQKNYNRFELNNQIIVNQNPDINSKNMNKNFIKLYYGLNEKNQLDLKPINLTFQSLFNSLINQYAFTQDNKSLWLSQAPENLKILANNSAINVEEIKDLYNQISKPIIFNFENKKISNTFQFQNKDKLNNPQVLFEEEKLKSTWFDLIKENLVKIINDFYKQTNNEENIYINIPVSIDKDNQEVNKKILLVKNILNSIDSRLKVNLTKIDDYEKYHYYFEENKSIYKKSTFKLFQGDTVEFIYNQLTNYDNNLVKLIDFLSKNKVIYQQIYKQLIKLNDFLISNNLSLENIVDTQTKNKVIGFIYSLKIEEQAEIINEINNLISYSMSFTNQININSFSKVVYQKNFKKPLGWNNLNYYQDIEINERRE